MANSLARRQLALSATELDQRVTIQEMPDTKDARGQLLGVWSDPLGPFWARARTFAVVDNTGANGVQSQDMVEFGLRWQPGFTSRKRRRIVWNGIPYDVTSIPANIDGGNHTLLFTCVGGKPV